MQTHASCEGRVEESYRRRPILLHARRTHADGNCARLRSTRTHYNLRFHNRAGKSLQELDDPLLLAVLRRYALDGIRAEERP